MPLIYIAAPYTHSDPDVREQRLATFCLVDAKLAMQGLHTVSPLFKALLFRYTDKVPTNWEFWKSYAETTMAVCDELVVVTIDGWDTSDGVLGEIDMANARGIPIRYIAP